MYACLYADSAVLARDAMLDWASRFSPHLEAGPDYVVIDIRGLRSLLGAPEQLARAFASGITGNANVAVASNPQAAIAAARGIRGITVIHPGDEAQKLGPLPLDLLPVSEDMAETLAIWGIRTFADLAGLPADGLAERLGPEAIQLQALAKGQGTRPLLPEKEAPFFEASQELDHVLESLEPLSFVLSRLLNEICARLSSEGLSANEVKLTLRLDDHSEFVREICLPFATRKSAIFLKLLQHSLANNPPQAAIQRVAIQAQPVRPRVVQGGLFLPVAPEPEKLELTLARVAAIVGAENIGSPEMLDTHRPDAFRMVRFETRHQTATSASQQHDEPFLSLRLFRPPLPAKVTAPSGKPERIVANGVTGKVACYGGPWRSSGDWWNSMSWTRDEWDVELDNGTLYRIYREMNGDWYIDGNYD